MSREGHDQRELILCRTLCRNPVIPARVGPCQAVSLGNTQETATWLKGAWILTFCIVAYRSDLLGVK
jgi:hypothetical protein